MNGRPRTGTKFWATLQGVAMSRIMLNKLLISSTYSQFHLCIVSRRIASNQSPNSHQNSHRENSTRPVSAH